MIRTLTFVALAAALATTARAQTVSPVPIGDEYFAMKAFADGTVEVAKGRLALERAADAEVKKFAGQMIKDHTECNNKIVELARVKGIALPTTIDAVHAVAMNRMAKLSGSDFDKVYMMSQIGAHKEALLLFGHEAHKGEDADLKALAHKTLPTLESHIKMAFEVAGEKEEGRKFEQIHDYAKRVMEGK